MVIKSVHKYPDSLNCVMEKRLGTPLPNGCFAHKLVLKLSQVKLCMMGKRAWKPSTKKNKASFPLLSPGKTVLTHSLPQPDTGSNSSRGSWVTGSASPTSGQIIILSVGLHPPSSSQIFSCLGSVRRILRQRCLPWSLGT